MMEQYIKCATRIIGELEIRYNWVSAKNNPREVVVNLWAQELTKIRPEALTPDVIRRAMEQWDVDSKNKPPLVGQFISILKGLTHDHQHRQALELENNKKEDVDYFKMFNNSDNRGKFGFFMENRNIPPVVKWYAKTWFTENTKFRDDQIIDIVNGRLPK